MRSTFGAERSEVVEILHADRAAADFVFVGRADAASRRADLAGAGGCFAQLIEFAMQRQDERGVFGDAQILAP